MGVKDRIKELELFSTAVFPTLGGNPFEVSLAEEGDSQDEDHDDFSYPIYPAVGSKWQHSYYWPASPAEAKSTIEVKLYWHEDDPDGLYWCRAVKKYVEYALLDAWGDDGYAVTVTIHEPPVPADADTEEEFESYYWSDNVDTAKDCNMILHDYGGVLGQAGGYGGWVSVQELFDGWGRVPGDPIKPLGGGNGSPSEGVARVLHEVGHCFGFGHNDESVRMYGMDWVAPMATGYDNSDASRFSFRYSKKLRNSTPRVQNES